ncbi:MAG: helix-turn-helix domain-containing protein [Hyphomicrobiaceae bacterium]
MNQALRKFYAIEKSRLPFSTAVAYGKPQKTASERMLERVIARIQIAPPKPKRKAAVASPKLAKVYEGERFVDLAEAAARLGVSRATLWRWRDKDKIPKSRSDPGGRRQGWLSSEFEAILAKNR